METVYLSLGSNLGDRKINLRRALRLLPPKVKVEAISPVYETDPMHVPDQPVFYNLVVRGSTKLTPQELLIYIKGIEGKMGRKSATHNLPRVIDIDILTYGDERVESDDLIIPHKRIPERAFVLVPLKDIAPRFTHPVSGEGITDMLQRLPDWKDVVRKTEVTV